MNNAILWETLCADVHELAQSKGWWDEDRPIRHSFALVHSEASEALEALRKPELLHACDKCDDHNGRGGTDCPKCKGTGAALCGSRFTEEIADVAIRLLDISGRYQVPFWEYLGLADRYFRGWIELQEFEDKASEVDALHDAIGEAKFSLISKHRENGPAVAIALRHCIDLAGGEQELREAMRAKHEYNKTRPTRHGKAF